MGKRVFRLVGLLVLAISVSARQAAPAEPGLSAAQPGVLVPKQICAKPEQSYALYLPSRYTPSKPWPIVYAFDPASRGKIPVELMKDAAERHGYIVVGSNNSRNGSWKVELEAAQAMLEDTHRRFAIDDQRLYFAGLSGGARVAALIAQRCKCAAGVILNGAGFPPQSPPSRDVMFAVFSAVGSFDFNYPEVTELNEKLVQLEFPHFFRDFEGPHEWAPAEVMEEALAWLRLVAMKQKREPRDDSFVAAQKEAAVAHARRLEASGDLYAAWREYSQQDGTFDGLENAAGLQAGMERLAKAKAVRDGAKREKREFEEQERLTAEISSGLAAVRDNAPGRSDARAQTRQKIVDLRERTSAEKNLNEQRVLRRALSGTMVGAMEAGEERLEAKEVDVAKDYFELAAEADPDSSWALGSVAMARALLGDRKGTLEELRRAKEKSKDRAAFSAWLSQEPAFAKLRDDPHFRALLSEP